MGFKTFNGYVLYHSGLSLTACERPFDPTGSESHSSLVVLFPSNRLKFNHILIHFNSILESFRVESNDSFVGLMVTETNQRSGLTPSLISSAVFIQRKPSLPSIPVLCEGKAHMMCSAFDSIEKL